MGACHTGMFRRIGPGQVKTVSGSPHCRGNRQIGHCRRRNDILNYVGQMFIGMIGVEHRSNHNVKINLGQPGCV